MILQLYVGQVSVHSALLCTCLGNDGYTYVECVRHRKIVVGLLGFGEGVRATLSACTILARELY